MCTADDEAAGRIAPGGMLPGTVADALGMARAGLGYLNSPAVADIDGVACGEVLISLGELQAKVAAARLTFLAKFDAAAGHDVDGYGSSSAWLAAKTKMTRQAAKATVRQMRRQAGHDELRDAMAAGQIPESLAAQIAEWTGKLPQEMRRSTDKILLDAALAGANQDDLSVIAAAAYERWRSRQPDPDEDDGFDDRYVQVGTTFGGAGTIRGNLSPECSAAVQAVLDALGKKQGAEDHRTEGQRFHDALQLGCELLIRAKMVPDRAGADTQVSVHIPLSQLRRMDGASAVEEAWLNARLGEPGYLTGKDAETAACDALSTPVVTGHADLTVIDTMIAVALAYAHNAVNPAGHGADTGGVDTGGGGRDAYHDRPATLSPEAYAALRHTMGRLAIDFVSGPSGIAGLLRTGLLQAPFNTPSLPLDIGFSENIPAHIRRAVILRDRRCAWPGCRRPVAHCDVHHIVHKKDGGKTSVGSCVLLCNFHHDICVHRWGWQIVLHPDGTTSAHGPQGQVLHSHSPPTLRAG